MASRSPVRTGTRSSWAWRYRNRERACRGVHRPLRISVLWPTFGLSEGNSLRLAIVTVGHVELVISRVTESDATAAEQLAFKQAADQLLASISFMPG